MEEGEDEEQEEGDGVRKELWIVCEMTSESELFACFDLLVALAVLEFGDSFVVLAFGLAFLGLVVVGLVLLVSVLVVVMSFIWSLIVSGWLW